MSFKIQFPQTMAIFQQQKHTIVSSRNFLCLFSPVDVQYQKAYNTKWQRISWVLIKFNFVNPFLSIIAKGKSFQFHTNLRHNLLHEWSEYKWENIPKYNIEWNESWIFL